MKDKRISLSVLVVVGLLATTIVGLPLLLLSNLGCSLHIERNRRIPLSAGRTILDSTSNIQNLWNISMLIPLDGIRAFNQNVYALDSACNEAVSLNVRNGELLWSAVIPQPDTMELDEARNRIYVSGLPLTALDSIKGDQIWFNTSLSFAKVGILMRLLDDGQLFVYASPDGRNFRVNSVNGEYETASKPPDIQAFIADGYFWKISQNALERTSQNEPPEIWKSLYRKFTDCCLSQVKLVDDFVLVLFDQKIFALDRQDGHLKWRFDEAVTASNFAANDTKVYVVDQNAKLYALDLGSGKVIETTQFAFPSKTAQSRGIYNSIFGTQLFFTDNILGVYFNDLKILSAYSGL
ncbi:MAG: PQQ-binding-like beta-propeller repeat protein [Chloroflexota bacterium]